MTEFHISSQKRLKILHLAYDHPDNPWCGGGGAIRAWAINNILARFHDITVYCGAFPEAKQQNQPFKVRYLGKAKNYKESRLKFIANSYRIDSHPYDLIVEEFSAFSPSLTKCNNKPLVTIVHYYLGLSVFRFRPILGIVAVLSEQLLLRKKKSVILVSEHLIKALRSDAQVTIITPGVNLPTDLPPSSEDFVLFLGRLDTEIKGLDTLINAWARLPDSVRTLPLYIAGGGDQTAVQKLIKTTGARDIHILGHLEHGDAMATIRRAAFLCAPSRMEGYGLVAAEAMALGKPVIVSSIPSFKRIVPHNEAGLHVPVDNVKILSQNIQELLSNKYLRDRLAEGAKKRKYTFCWEQTAKAQENFYFKVLSIY